MKTGQRTSVLIVGGALTGLSSAVFLAAQGVPCMVVERHRDLLLHPRLRGLSPRTVEIYRQFGLEPAINAAGYADPETFQWSPVRAETLADETYGEVEELALESGLDAATPASNGPIDQDKLEIVLRARARALGADVRFATELLSYDEREDGVRAILSDRTIGETYEIRAEYLIAADGANSPIRQGLGIEVDGPGMLYHTITAMVNADLTPALRGRDVAIAYLQRPRPFTILMSHDNAGRQWVFGTGYDPTQESLDDYSDERIVEMLRAAAGLPDVEVTVRPQIPGTDISVLGFPIGAQVARSFRSSANQGRVFLAGDAARINPPTGGLGGNAGVQDAHNLAWKLAAVLKGYAGAALLDTYEAERRPVAQLTMEQAFARFGARMAAGAEIPLIDYGAVVMGYRYRSAAVLGAGENLAPLRPAELSGEPGTRAPHVEITVAGTNTSTIDLYGKGFVLLTGERGEAWLAAAKDDSLVEQGIPLEAYPLDRAAGHRHGIGETGALLVRPDGFVAWRRPDQRTAGDVGPAPAADAEVEAGAVLAGALRAILALPTVGSAGRPAAPPASPPPGE